MTPFALRAATLMTFAMLSALPAVAETTWEGLRTEVFGDRPIQSGEGIVTLSAPTRPEDQSAVPISATAKLQDGRTIRAVHFIVDENPSPIAAVFKLGGARTAVSLGMKLRLNTVTDVRVVVEASDGALYMQERYVKFAGGQSACNAPPVGDPKEIQANMGRMDVAQEAAPHNRTLIQPKATLNVNHPNHTGMVLDPIKLHYIPLKIVDAIEVRQGDETVFTMTGSITVSQNPSIDFDYRLNGADDLVVSTGDSDGGRWSERFPIHSGS